MRVRGLTADCPGVLLKIPMHAVPALQCSIILIVVTYQ
jgi:hypothetical protein